jgi:DNA primase
MNADAVRKFLSALNAKSVQSHGKWVTACCPLGPWRHKGGKDTNPSFGVAVSKGRSHFNCFSCGAGGNLESLLMELTHWNKDAQYPMDFALAFHLLEEEEKGFIEGPEWSPFGPKKEPPQPWPEEWLESFAPVDKIEEAENYLLSERGVNPTLALKFNLRWDSAKRTICFPYYLPTGEFAGMRGRFIDPDAPIRYFDYTYKGINNSGKVWYWGHKVNWNRPIIITEGSFDAMAVWRWYSNVVSPFSAGVPSEKIGWLSNAIAVICLFDNDDAGEAGYEKLRKTLGKTIAVRRITPPAGQDAAKMPPEQLKEALNKYVTVFETSQDV